MIKEAINLLVNGQDLDYETSEKVMGEIMSGEASQVSMAAFLTVLRMKGETIEEITACDNGMRKVAKRLEHTYDVLEIVGTGGDEANTFNISTVSSMVVSATGIKVAKHGNRSVSSKCGAADCLEALGVKLDIEPEQSKAILDEAGVCFMFAQKYHGAMRFVAPVRKELGLRTIFNILGPLANPANANMQLLGVYEESLVKPLAQVLVNLGVKRGMVVYGQDGLDEISLSAPTTCCEIRDGVLKGYVITPEQFGFKRCKKEELVGGDPAENAVIAREILNGKKGPMRDVVVLNSAACVYFVNDNVTMEEAVKLAEEAIDSGKALAQLDRFVEMSNN